jgi:YidC/Oxa1 family membrane protein insertase
LNDNRNLIIAIVLSLLVLLGWNALSHSIAPTAKEPSTRIENGKQVAVPQPGQLPTAPQTPAQLRDVAVVKGESPRVAIQTPALNGSINLKGARIDDLLLTNPQYTETISDDSQPVRLLSPAGARDAYFAEFGWQAGPGISTPDAQTLWQTNGPRLAPGIPVTLSWDNGQGLTFQIVLSVDENFLFTTEQRVFNHGTAPVKVRPYSLLVRQAPEHDPHIWTMHLGPVGMFNGAADYSHTYTAVANGEAAALPASSAGGWLGFSDKYWLTAIVPGQDAQIEPILRKDGDTFRAAVTMPEVSTAPGQVTTTISHLFAGAKEVGALETYGAQLGTNLDKAIDWGWYEWFMRPIFSLLLWLFHTVGNFGLAIICLTLIVRLLMFPIAQKQFQSMGKMRAISPKMKALQERYKDDKPRLQQETLKLYKAEKVNPAAGCLPILIQIPVFYALYRTLTISVEMRHQPFVAWIQDLSAPDPLTPVNLFGFLPFEPPGILHVGVLAIMIGVTMFFQQKLNPPMPDPVQRRIFSFMPWFLMLVMSPFAAGLQLYWVTNNLLSIAQQQWLYMRHPELRLAPTPPPAPAPVELPTGDRPRRERKPRAR